MKKFLCLLIVAVLFGGCNIKPAQHAITQDNGVTQIGDNIYVKRIEIHYGDGLIHTIYVYCTADGAIIPNTSISTHYTNGKTQENITVVR